MVLYLLQWIQHLTRTANSRILVQSKYFPEQIYCAGCLQNFIMPNLYIFPAWNIWLFDETLLPSFRLWASKTKWILWVMKPHKQRWNFLGGHSSAYLCLHLLSYLPWLAKEAVPTPRFNLMGNNPNYSASNFLGKLIPPFPIPWIEFANTPLRAISRIMEQLNFVYDVRRNVNPLVSFIIHIAILYLDYPGQVCWRTCHHLHES